MSETLAGGILPTTTPDPVSARDVEPLVMMLAGTGDSVVTENNGAAVVLEIEEPREDEQLVENAKDESREFDEGQMVTSDDG